MTQSIRVTFELD